MSRPGVIIYEEMFGSIEQMTDREVGMFVKAILRYAFKGIEPELPRNLMLLWYPVKRKLDLDEQAYQAKVERMNRVNEDRKRKREAESNPACVSVPPVL